MGHSPVDHVAIPEQEACVAQRPAGLSERERITWGSKELVPASAPAGTSFMRGIAADRD
jgi:hypothetical protein